MGYLRLFLAVAVVAAHSSPILGFTLISGRTAVECFFVISGFYMAMVLDRKYLKLPARRWSTFVSARIARLFPLYGLVLGLTALFILAGGTITVGNTEQQFSMMHLLNPPALVALISTNLTILGQDWSFFASFLQNGELRVGTNAQPPLIAADRFYLVPQAWTVALELIFYGIAPFVAKRRNYVLWTIFGVSIILRAVGYVLHLRADPWSYRFFPFELAYFMAGMLSYRYRSTLCRIAPSFASPILIPVILLLLPRLDVNPGLYNAAMLVVPIVIAAAIPSLFEMTRHSRVDRWIGELSYPLYLVHVLVLSTLRQLGSSYPIDGLLAVAASIAAAIAIVYLFDRPVEHKREKVVRRKLKAGGVEDDRDGGISPAAMEA